MEQRRHKGDVSAQPARPPRPPCARRPQFARPGSGAANTHHHGCSEARASAGAYCTAGRGGRRRRRRLQAGGASEQPAPPCPALPSPPLPDAGGRGLRAEEGLSALRPELLAQPRLSKPGNPGARCLETARAGRFRPRKG